MAMNVVVFQNKMGPALVVVYVVVSYAISGVHKCYPSLSKSCGGLPSL